MAEKSTELAWFEVVVAVLVVIFVLFGFLAMHYATGQMLMRWGS